MPRSPFRSIVDELAAMTGSLRVAYLTGEYPRATDTWIQREVAALRRRGVTVDTFAVRQPGDEQLVGPEQRAEKAGTTYLLPRLRSLGAVWAHVGLALRSPRRYGNGVALAWRTRRHGLRGTAYQAAYLAEAGVLAAEVRRRGIAHLHNHFGDSSCTVAMLAAALGGFGYSFTLHGPAIFFEAHTWRLDEKLTRAEFCACISYFCRGQAAIFSGADHLDRLHIVHCGVDLDGVEPVIHSGEGTRLVFVARLAEVKGLGVLLDAVARVRADHPSVTLTVVGDGPERARFEAQAARLGMTDAVDFVGYRSQSEVAEHLSSSDVFVLPSFAEGVPVTLMEAMGAGLPVVATQVGGVSELVDDGANGFIVRPGDPAGLAERLTQLITDPALRQKMGAAGRSTVEADFTNDVESGRLATLFTDALAGRRSALRPAPTAPELAN